MLRETLTAIAQAGRAALQRTVAPQEPRILATQVREWSFALPGLGRVTVANSPVHQVYLGFSRPLAAHLADAAGQERVLEEFKNQLVERVPARRPIGSWQRLPPDGSPRVLRGVRSFILRQQTAAGNLYLMADLASRAEFESLRDPGWDLTLAEQSLPRDIGKRETLEGGAAIRRLTSYLLRCEHDLELLVPGPDDLVHAGNAVVLGREREDDREFLVVSLDLDQDQRAAIDAGVEVEGAFGAAGRVFRFRSRCDGPRPLDLEGLATLPCVRLEVPARYVLDQRRRYFRVQPQDALSGHLVCLPPEAVARPSEDPYGRRARPDTGPPADAETVEVVDLSFSGAGVLVPAPAPQGLARDGLVRLWLHGTGFSQPAMVTGLVRRCELQPCGRGRQRVSLGLEFVMRGPDDRQGTQQVRQYVMAQQRSLLASRSAQQEPAPATGHVS